MEFFPGWQELLAIIAPWGIKEDEPGAFKDQFMGIDINHIVVEVILGQLYGTFAGGNISLTLRYCLIEDLNMSFSSI